IWTAVLCIDPDDFKTVNDSLGHAAGDRMLQEIGGRLRSVVRRADSVARLGGREFAVLLQGGQRAATAPGPKSPGQPRPGVAKPIALGPGVTAHSGASIGIAFGDPDDSV